MQALCTNRRGGMQEARKRRNRRPCKHKAEALRLLRSESVLPDWLTLAEDHEDGGIAVDAWKKGVHPDIGEDDAQESDEGEESGLPAFPSHDDPHMEVDGIDDPGDEGPGLLGVPEPVAAPGGFRPDGTGDDDEGEEEVAGGYRTVADGIEFLQGGDMCREERVLLEVVPQEVHGGDTEGYPESAIAHDGRRHMEQQPVALKRRHEGPDILVLHRRIANDDEDDRDDERAHGSEPVPSLKDDEDQGDAPGEACRELILVGERDTATANPARNQSCSMEEEARPDDKGAEAPHPFAFPKEEGEVQDHGDDIGDKCGVEKQVLHLQDAVSHQYPSVLALIFWMSPSSKRSLRCSLKISMFFLVCPDTHMRPSAPEKP